MLHAKRPDVGELLQCNGAPWKHVQQECMVIFPIATGSDLRFFTRFSVNQRRRSETNRCNVIQPKEQLGEHRTTINKFILLYYVSSYDGFFCFSVLYRIILELTKIYMSVAFVQDTRIKCALHVFHGRLKKKIVIILFLYIFFIIYRKHEVSRQ